MQRGCYFNYYDPMMRIRPTQAQTTPKPAPMNPSDFETAPGSPTNLGTDYTQGYLKTQIGKRMRVTFLLGTNLIQDRSGVLTDVGISYIILREDETNRPVLCDIYSVKFVNIYM
jgi:hypothetical protein